MTHREQMGTLRKNHMMTMRFMNDHQPPNISTPPELLLSLSAFSRHVTALLGP